MCDVQIDAVNAVSKSKGSGSSIEWRVGWFSRDLGGVEALVGSVGYASLVQFCLPFATSGLRVVRRVAAVGTVLLVSRWCYAIVLHD